MDGKYINLYGLEIRKWKKKMNNKWHEARLKRDKHEFDMDKNKQTKQETRCKMCSKMVEQFVC